MCNSTGLVYKGLTPQQQPGSYQGGKMMMMKSVFWWRKPEYPEETTDQLFSNRPGHVEAGMMMTMMMTMMMAMFSE